MTTDAKQMWRKLALAGIRPTRQRLELAEILFGCDHRHFTAEHIHAEAQALRYPPSLGTIYNTLNQFVAHGLLRQIALYDAKVWFNTRVGPHSHYYFEDTGKLEDIPAECLPHLDITVPEGTEVTAIDIIVRLKTTLRR